MDNSSWETEYQASSSWWIEPNSTIFVVLQLDNFVCTEDIHIRKQIERTMSGDRTNFPGSLLWSASFYPPSPFRLDPASLPSRGMSFGRGQGICKLIWVFLILITRVYPPPGWKCKVVIFTCQGDNLLIILSHCTQIKNCWINSGCVCIVCSVPHPRILSKCKIKVSVWGPPGK